MFGFLPFYSTGYFESKNCRCEIYAAIEMDTPPIIVVYDANESLLDTMRLEIKKRFDSTEEGVGTIILQECLLLLGDRKPWRVVRTILTIVQ